jgi:predicted enzyme related to lactoylglutathione lyase
MIEFECSFVVESLDETIENNGGKMVAANFHVPTVYTAAYFQDTAGNVAALSEPEKA